MSRWGLGRRPRGRHALGAAVTEIPSAPVRVALPVPATVGAAVTGRPAAEPSPVAPPVVLERVSPPPPTATIPDLAAAPRMSFETVTLEPDFLASPHVELHGGHQEGVGLALEFAPAAPLSAPDTDPSAAPADRLVDPPDVTIASGAAWSPPGVAPETDLDAGALSSTSWYPDPDVEWVPDPVPPSDALTQDLAGSRPPAISGADAESFASLFETAADWPDSSAPVAVPTGPLVDLPAALLPDVTRQVVPAGAADDLPADLPLEAPDDLPLDAVDATILVGAPPLPLQVIARVQLGFRDGTTALLDPDSEQAHALEELALMLTTRH